MLSAITMMLSACIGSYPAMPEGRRISADAADLSAAEARTAAVTVQAETKTDAAGWTYTEGQNGAVITGYTGSQTALTIPKKIGELDVVSIGNNAFADNTKLVSVDIPGCVRSIGEAAFKGCVKLASVSLHEGLENLDDCTFEGTALTEIFIPASLKSVDYSYYGTFCNCDKLTTVKFGAEMTVIPANLFKNCKSLTTVTLPDATVKIGDSAFKNCTHLTGITIPENVETIADSAFEGCERMEALDVPGNVQSIGSAAFKNCSKLASITLNEGLMHLDDCTFEGTAITSIHIPASLKQVDYSYYGTFCNCEKLTTATFAKEMVTLPAMLFKNCTSLTTVTLSESLEKIGDEAFRNCTRLTGVTLPAKLESIGDNAFEGCEKLTEMDIPENVLAIGEAAFKNCTRLASITLHEGLQHLDDCSFEATAITSIHIPASLKQVDYSYYGTFCNCNKLTAVTFGDGMLTLPANLFRNSPALANITLPESLEVIGEGAFKNCVRLAEITIPKTVDTIGDSAFEGCEKLTAVDIPENVLRIGEYAFKNCTKLASVQLHEGLQSLDDCSFEATAITEIFIPASLKMVDYSYYGTFCNCQKLTKVTFAEGVTDLPGWLFRNCTSLKEIVLPDGLLTTGEGTFCGCTNLTSVIFPASLEKINDSAFEGCVKLTAVDIPKNVTAIGEYAFKNCKRLASVQLHDGLENLDDCCFEGTAISEIYIPGTLRKVDYSYYGAFCNCPNLTHAVLGDGIVTVPDNLFQNCKSLTTVTLPASVETIGDYAFCNCVNLSRFHAPQTSFGFHPHSFENCDQLTDNRFTLFDDDHTGISSNANLASVNGLVSYTVQYQIRENVADDVSDLQLMLRIPYGLTLLADSFTCSDEDADLSNVTNGIIGLTASSGMITFSARVVENGNYQVGASMDLRYNGDSWNLNIGTMKVEVPAVMINTADTTNSYSAKVFGITNKGAEVEIFVNGQTAGTVKANAYTGKFSAAVALPEAPSGTEYQITAQANGVVSEAVTTVYQADKPAVQQVVMSYGGNSSLDITNVLTEGVSPVISFNPANPLRFEVTVSNTDRVRRLFVTSDKGSEMKYLEASYDAAKGVWVAEGYFDPTNHSYVPGSLNISIFEKTIDFVDEDTYDFTAADTMPMPKEVLNNSKVEILEQTENAVAASITLSNGSTTGTYQQYSAKADGIYISGKYHTAAEIAADPEAYGYKKLSIRSESGGKTYAYYYRSIGSEDAKLEAALQTKQFAAGLEDLLTGTSILRKLEGNFAANELTEPIATLANNYITGQFREILKYQSEELFGMDLYGDISTGLSIVSSTAGMIYNMQRAENDPELQAAVLTLYAVKMFRTLGGDEIWMAAVGIAPPTSIVLAVAIDLALDLVEEYLEECLAENKEFSLSGFVRFIIDPSGIVYEAVPGNTVDGASVTVYYQNPETGEAVKWNAEDYDQSNPLTTAEDGKYLWDVPEGVWKVVCEKDGYEKTETEWMTVPPVRTEVNIGIVSKEAPKLTEAKRSGDSLTVTFSKFVDVASVTAETLKLEGFTGKYQITPQLLSEKDRYTDTFVITGEALNTVTAVSAGSGVLSYAGTAAEAGSVSLTKKGDVNGDGDINLKDVVLIRRYIAGGFGTKLDEAIADMNGDGIVNLKDVVMLRRQIAGGWDQ